jgi:hypothetical protein
MTVRGQQLNELWKVKAKPLPFLMIYVTQYRVSHSLPNPVFL